jgi:hypothetical protein
MEKVQIDQLLSTQIPRIYENNTDILLEDEALPGQQPPVRKRSNCKNKITLFYCE